jgi:hypothetical protein
MEGMSAVLVGHHGLVVLNIVANNHEDLKSKARLKKDRTFLGPWCASAI